MTQAFRAYLLAIVAVSLLASILLTLVPKGGIHRTLSFLCGLALILVSVGPLAKLDFADLARSFAKIQVESDTSAGDIQTDNTELIAAIIKEKAETYIWDKAAALGLSVTVTVEVETDGDYPYPHSAAIRGLFSRQQRTQLERDIEANLAIPSDRQEWSTYE